MTQIERVWLLQVTLLGVLTAKLEAATAPNNFAPTFKQRIYSVSAPEDVLVGKIVVRVVATDDDPGSVVTYDFFPNDFFSNHSNFGINKTSGEISVTRRLDREIKSVYRVPVRAYDDGNPQKSGRTLVFITVRDTNDNRPTFSPSYYSVEVDDAFSIGQSILTLTAMDKDKSVNAVLSYQIVRGNEINSTFSITSHGDIVLIRKLDFTRWRFYNLTVQARDTGDNPLTSSNNATVLITVITNRFSIPQFDPSHYLFMVREDVRVPHFVGQVYALYFNPKSGHDDNDVIYQIETGNLAGNFHLSATGNLTVVKSLDRETESLWKLVVSATDILNRSISSSTVVEVSVLDVNDNSPLLIPKGSVDVTILENAAINDTLTHFTCSDNDIGLSGDVALSLLDVNNMFSLSGNDIILKKQPLVLSNSTFNLTVVCSDFGTPRRTSQSVVRVHVVNVNMYSPSFDKRTYSTAISENSQVGTSVITVHATDKDQGLDGRVVYSLAGSKGVFKIDSLTGIVYTDQSLDRETKDKYILEVVATDQGMPSHSGSALLTVLVNDVNDNGPHCERTEYHVSVSENANEVVNVNCVDHDHNAQPIYRVVAESDPNVFGIEVRGIVVVKNDLSRLTPVDYWLKIQVEDSNTLVQKKTVNLTVFIHVNRSNDFPPVFEHGGFFSWNITKQTAVGTIVNKVIANDDDVGLDGEIRYSLVKGTGKNMFSVNATDGGIQLQRSLSTTNDVSTLTLIIEAADQAVPLKLRKKATAEVTFTIIDVSPRLKLLAKTVRVWRSAEVGTSVVNATCITSDSRDKGVGFSLKGSNSIDSFLSVDNQGNIKVKASLGVLNLGNYSVTVSCQDSHSYSSVSTFMLRLIEPITAAVVSPSEGLISMAYASNKVTPSTYLITPSSGAGVVDATASTTDSSRETLIVAIIGAVCGLMLIILLIMVAVIVRWKTEHGSYNPRKEKLRKNLNNELTEVALQKVDKQKDIEMDSIGRDKKESHNSLHSVNSLPSSRQGSRIDGVIEEETSTGTFPTREQTVQTVQSVQSSRHMPVTLTGLRGKYGFLTPGQRHRWSSAPVQDQTRLHSLQNSMAEIGAIDSRRLSLGSSFTDGVSTVSAPVGRALSAVSIRSESLV